MATIGIKDGVTVSIATQRRFRSTVTTCVLSAQAGTRLTQREALKLGKILLSFGEKGDRS